MPDEPRSLTPTEILEIKNVLSEALGRMYAAKDYARRLLSERGDQHGPLRSLPSASPLAERAKDLQRLANHFLSVFGETERGFVYPKLKADGLQRQNHFWW